MRVHPALQVLELRARHERVVRASYRGFGEWLKWYEPLWRSSAPEVLAQANTLIREPVVHIVGCGPSLNDYSPTLLHDQNVISLNTGWMWWIDEVTPRRHWILSIDAQRMVETAKLAYERGFLDSTFLVAPTRTSGPHAAAMRGLLSSPLTNNWLKLMGTGISGWPDPQELPTAEPFTRGVQLVGKSCVYSAIQWARHLGAKVIYLHGIDLDWSLGHFDQKIPKKQVSPLTEQRAQHMMPVMGELYRWLGIEIRTWKPNQFGIPDGPAEGAKNAPPQMDESRS